MEPPGCVDEVDARRVREMGKGKVDRRLAVRESGPFPAVAKLYGGQSHNCVVVDLSERGARLALAGKGATLPTEFELIIPSRSASWRVRVVWQEGNEVGVCRL
jgi:hypothetical protein